MVTFLSLIILSSYHFLFYFSCKCDTYKETNSLQSLPTADYLVTSLHQEVDHYIVDKFELTF